MTLAIRSRRAYSTAHFVAMSLFSLGLFVRPVLADPALEEVPRTAVSMTDGTSSSIVQRAKVLSSRALERTTALTEAALSALGVKYKFGGANPEQGFDCSGLVRFVFQQVTGISLPHNALQQSREGREIDPDELMPGDLVFFNTRKFAFSHVGIYIGDNKFVHAPSKGKLVQVVEFNNPYWQRAFNGARRVIETAPQVFGSPATAATPPREAPEPAALLNAPHFGSQAQ